MYREPTVTERKLGLKSTVWLKETVNPNSTKKQEFKKVRRDLFRLRRRR